MSSMAPSNAQTVQRHRARRRAQGLRLRQLWLPDTRTPEFAAQVAQAIVAVARLSPEDEAMLDAFEEIAAGELRKWD